MASLPQPPPSPPLCTPLAATVPNPTKNPKTDVPMCSPRLAAKPTVGIAIMDKVKLVLLKKNGINADKAYHKDALKKYNDIYKQQLPLEHIKAVVSLVDSS
jgi:hypothetical protein